MYEQRIYLNIYPTGEPQYEVVKDIKTKKQKLSVSEVDELFVFGNEYNYVIQECLDCSKFGMLDNWEISKIEDYATLGMLSALDRMEHLDKLKKRQFKKDFKDLTNNCWIAPNGNYFNIKELGGHNEFAHNWFKKNFEKKVSIFSYHCEELEKLGWVRVQGWRSVPEFYSSQTHKVNHKQWETVLNICKKFNLKLPEFYYRGSSKAIW